MLDFMDTSQEQEHDFGVLLKQGAEGVSSRLNRYEVAICP